MAIPLAYEGSELPDSVRKAAQGLLDYQKAVGNKLPLAVEGSGIPDSVRKAAQAALEKGSYEVPKAAAAAAPEVAEAAGKGILGRIGGAAFGPVGVGIQAALQPGSLGDGELTRAQQQAQATQAVQNMGPDVAGQAAAWSQNMADKAVDNRYGGPQGADLLMPPPQPEQGPPEQAPQAPQQSPMEVPPQVQEAQGAQAADQAAAQAQQEESQRQILETGAQKGLTTGQVSRPDLAEAVVKADMERSGEKATPDAVKAAVATELTQMRTMDNSDLARYVSYAIMGAGLIGSFLDKSGETGRAFAQGYENQQNRNMTMLQMQQKAQADAADRALKSREVTVKEKVGDSTVDTNAGKLKIEGGKLANDTVKTGGLLDKWEADAEIGRSNVAAKIRGQDIGASTAIRGQNLSAETTRRGQDMTQQNAQGTQKVSSENAQLNAAVRLKTASQAAQAKIAAANAKAKSDSGVTLSNKDARGIIDSIDGTAVVGNQKASAAAKAAKSVELQNAVKNNPGVDVGILAQKLYGTLEPRKTGGILWTDFGSKDRDLPASK